MAMTTGVLVIELAAVCSKKTTTKENGICLNKCLYVMNVFNMQIILSASFAYTCYCLESLY